MSVPEDISNTPVAEEASGVMPASRPLRNPKTVESFQPVSGDELPHVPARPLRRSSTEASIDSGSSTEKGVREAAATVMEPVVPSRPSAMRTHSSTSTLGSATSTKETPKDSQPFVPPRPMRTSASHEQEAAIREPHIPDRPVKVAQESETMSEVEPKVPSRPSRRPETSESPVASEGSTVGNEIPVPPRPHHEVNKAESHEESSLQPEQDNKQPGKNELPEETQSVDDSMAPFLKDQDESQIVEPLMPKRPVRRTTEDIATPSIPLRPRKAATSGDLLASKRPVQETAASEEVQAEEPIDDMLDAGREEEEGIDDTPVEALDVMVPVSGSPEPVVEEQVPITDETEKDVTVAGSEADETVEETPGDVAKVNAAAVEETPVDVGTTAATPADPEPQAEDTKETPSTEPVAETSSSDAKEPPSSSDAKEPLPSVPSRLAKKGPPPVPKKPSSKIAAFHQMLQRQQMKNLGMDETPAESPREFQSDSPASTGSDTREQSRDQPPVAPSKRPQPALHNNINGMFALPGMIPGMLPGMVPGGVLPPSLSKKLGISTPDQDNSDTSKPQGALSDVRQRRARGPRGRKLPTKISKIEKVVDTSGANDIEMFSTWTITVTPKPESVSEPAATEAPTQDATLVEPVPLSPVPTQLVDTVAEAAPVSATDAPVEPEVCETPVSLGEAIETMDGDDKPVYLEHELEEMAQSLMEKEMLKGNIDETETPQQQEEDEFGEPIAEEDIPE